MIIADFFILLLNSLTASESKTKAVTFAFKVVSSYPLNTVGFVFLAISNHSFSVFPSPLPFHEDLASSFCSFIDALKDSKSTSISFDLR